MKRATLLIFPVALIMTMAVGCDRKVVNEYVTEPPPGETAVCFTCHGDNDFALVAARDQYDRSKHATGNTYNRNRLYSSRYSSCEPCHTNEGFVAMATGKPAAGDQFTPIACFTCHEPHTSGTLALRYNSAVTLADDNVYNKGLSNLCASCHHSRQDVNTYVIANDTIDNRFGPHHSNQSDMLLGTNGYEFADYDYDRTHAHANAQNGCLQCHMAAPLYGTGGHTFVMLNEDEEHENISGCNTGCHEGGVEEFDHHGEQTVVMGLLGDLEELLFDADLLEWVDEDGEMVLLPTEDRVIMTADSAGALFNYMFVREDRSEGIHNLSYAEDLLQSSIAFMSDGGAAKHADAEQPSER